MRVISKKSKILKYLISLDIPHFSKENVNTCVLSVKNISSTAWYTEFVNIIKKNIGKKYFPIIRLSDGEYIFLVGLKKPLYYGNFFNYIRDYVIFLYEKFYKYRTKFKARTLPNVSSGTYTKNENNLLKKFFLKEIKKISNEGILALHLTYAEKSFQERYHFPIYKIFKENNIEINQFNYYPFYFVYALLMGKDNNKLFRKRRILIIHSATGDKKERINNYFISIGVEKIEWIKISSSRSFYDKIDCKKYIGKF